MLIYSVVPTKSYSKQLLDFAYRKPLYTVVFFVVGLLIITLLFGTILSLNVPLMGSTTITLPTVITSGVTISFLVSAEFWPFWLAAVAAGLCLAARLYHKRVVTAAQKPEQVTPVAAKTEPPTSPPETAAT